jgi:hypothetical protein
VILMPLIKSSPPGRGGGEGELISHLLATFVSSAPLTMSFPKDKRMVVGLMNKTWNLFYYICGQVLVLFPHIHIHLNVVSVLSLLLGTGITKKNKTKALHSDQKPYSH